MSAASIISAWWSTTSTPCSSARRKIPAGQHRQAPLDAAVRATTAATIPTATSSISRRRTKATSSSTSTPSSRPHGWSAGPLPQQVRDPHAQPGEVRRVLSRCVRAQAREPQRRRARPSPDRRPRDALDHAVVDPGLREHVDQAPRPRPHRLQGREPRRLQAARRDDLGHEPLSRADAARRQQGSPTRARRSSPRRPAANSRWPTPAASGSTSPTNDAIRHFRPSRPQRSAARRLSTRRG